MPYDFDRIVERRRTDSNKWRKYGPDVLPLWVADMDFPSPEPVVRALRERVEHGVFGYGYPVETVTPLQEVFADRLARLYGWHVSPEAVVLVPGVIPGFNVAARTVAGAGDGVLLALPLYPPLLRVPGNVGLTMDAADLSRSGDGRYEIEFDALARAVTPRTRFLLLCNPHNPVGRVFRRDELERMAEICLRRGVIICSDEIHCDLLYTGQRHIPIASLDPDIAQNTITLIAPTKTFNLPGLQCSIAIVQNPELRQKYQEARKGLAPWVNVMGLLAAQVAYREGQDWLDQLLAYLEANRDYLYDVVQSELTGITMTRPEATYLAWLDCRQTGTDGNAYEFFLQKARVALGDGVLFGPGGEGFLRLNFGCSRALLAEALERMKRALAPS